MAIDPIQLGQDIDGLAASRIYNMLQATQGDGLPTLDQVKALIRGTIKGPYNATTNTPNLTSPAPGAIFANDKYNVTVGGAFFTTTVAAGDVLIALVDDPAVLSDWAVIEMNIVDSDDIVEGAVNKFVTATIQAALNAANSPSGANPFLTALDIPDQLDIIYVAQDGSDLNDGKTINKAVATLDKAIDLSEANGGYNNRKVIWVFDANFYEINEKTITDDTTIFAPNADIYLNHVTAVTGFGLKINGSNCNIIAGTLNGGTSLGQLIINKDQVVVDVNIISQANATIPLIQANTLWYNGLIRTNRLRSTKQYPTIRVGDGSVSAINGRARNVYIETVEFSGIPAGSTVAVAVDNVTARVTIESCFSVTDNALFKALSVDGSLAQVSYELGSFQDSLGAWIEILNASATVIAEVGNTNGVIINGVGGNLFRSDASEGVYIPQLTTATPVAADDYIKFHDDTDDTAKKATIAAILALGGAPALSAVLAVGNTSGAYDISMDSLKKVLWGSGVNFTTNDATGNIYHESNKGHIFKIGIYEGFIGSNNLYIKNTTTGDLLKLAPGSKSLIYDNGTFAANLAFPALSANLNYLLQSASGTLAFLTDIPTSLPPNGSAGGDLSGTYPNPNIANNAVTNVKAADMAANTVKVRNAGTSGDPADLAMPASTFLARLASGNIVAATVAQVKTLIGNFTSVLSGLVPASGGGTTNFLRADGTWAAISGASFLSTTVTTAAISTDQDDFTIAGFAPGVYLRFNCTSNMELTGFLDTGFSARDVFGFSNIGTGDVKIKNNSASSLANNRILTNGDFTIKPNQGCIFVRDGVSLRWRIFVHRT